MKNIVVFASGSGTNFQAIIDAVEEGKIDARINGLITNKSSVKAIDRAKNHQIPVRTIKPSSFDEYIDYEEELLQQLENWSPDLIVLAGYMIKIPESVIAMYRNRIINIHPSLLPDYGGKGFYGDKVHKAVIENNEKVSGCTVHFVTEGYDEGPVIAQRKVNVFKNDDASSLAKRILKQEHQLYPEVIAKLIEDLN